MECVVLCLWRLVRRRQAPSLSALAAKSRCHCLRWWCGPARSARPARPRRCSSTASPPAGLPRRPGWSGASAGEHGRSCVTHVTREKERCAGNVPPTCCIRTRRALNLMLWLKSSICAWRHGEECLIFIFTPPNVFDKDHVVPDGSPCRFRPGYSG